MFNQLVLNKIMTYLGLQDLYNCSVVCKKFNEAFNNILLWKKKTQNLSQFTLDYIKRDIYVPQNTELDRLKSLYAIDYLSRRIPGDYFNESTLILPINSERITKFPLSVFLVTDLEYLKIKHSSIKRIPNHFDKMPLLERFTCKNSMVRELPEMPYVQLLNVKNNYFKDFNTVPKHITYLNIQHNLLENLKGIGENLVICVN